MRTPAILSALVLVGCSTASQMTSPDAGGADAAYAIPQGLEIPTAQGMVRGATSGKTRAFRGIPFAAPPVGANRFRPPQPAAPWSGTRDAIAFGKQCAQLGLLSSNFDASSDEDCLTLNVFSPDPAPAASRPVMVFLHGGGFVLGTGSDPTYHGESLVETSGVVLVTINYRLGPLGFLAHAALTAEDPSHATSGNYGLEDQRAALAWVRENIAAFGGDPNQVTLFGESAGAISTCLHLMSTPTRGLFQRAIVESGACGTRFFAGPQAAAEAQGDALAKAVGCTDANAVASCLRGKTTRELVTALPLKTGFIYGVGVEWGPHADGVDVPRIGDSITYAPVPVLLGTNANEGTLFLALGFTPANEAEYRAALAGRFDPAVVDPIVAEYPLSAFATPAAALAEVTGDGLFVCSTRRFARALAAAGNPTFLYQFAHPVTSPLIPNLGAFHGSELLFVFGNSFLGATASATEQPLVRAIQGYWSRMAKAGDPNGDGAVAWPAYAAATDENLTLDLQIAANTGLKKARCDFWDTIAF